MTAPTLIADDRESRTALIPAADLRVGHVIAYFDGSEHRVDRFFTRRWHLDEATESWYRDSDRHPPLRTAVAADGWAIDLMPGQKVRVRIPTDQYEVAVYQATTPSEPAEVVPFVAETRERALVTARRILHLLDGAWGDITQGGVDIDVVTVS